MVRFTLPEWVQEHAIHYNDINAIPRERIEKIKSGLKKFHVKNPEVSIVIPAYNEEKNILKTLSSLSVLKTHYATELIVANNNSKDQTQEILDLLEVKSVMVKDQGISYARQGGLETAKGIYILNADSDSIYPSGWCDPYVEVLKDPEISCAYGSYSFIPESGGTNRTALAFYEIAARSIFTLKRKNRECVNVMGFNFAFRKKDAISVGGFNHNLQRKITERSEDGWMALCLMKEGRLQYLSTEDINVWTSDRRLMEDGGLGQAFIRRVKKEASRVTTYFKPAALTR